MCNAVVEKTVQSCRGAVPSEKGQGSQNGNR